MNKINQAKILNSLFFKPLKYQIDPALYVVSIHFQLGNYMGCNFSICMCVYVFLHMTKQSVIFYKYVIK